MQNLRKYSLLAGILLLAFTGCQEEDFFGKNDPNNQIGDNLVFSVDLTSGSTTKSTYVGGMDLVSEDGQKINVSMAVLDSIAATTEKKSHTRGALIDADNFTTYVSDIAVLGYTHGTTGAYVSVNDGPETLSKVGTHDNTAYPTHWAPANNYFWPKGFNLDFWAWAPKATFDAASTATSAASVKVTNLSVNNNPSSGNPNISFHYNLGNGTDATALPDLMFATTQDIRKGSGTVNDGCVPLNFKHALAAVQFKVVSTKGAKVHEIKLVDVVKEGDCTFVLGDAPFTWANNSVSSSNKGTYTHDFNASVTADTPSDFYESQPTANFMMIPQTLGTQSISISISTDANSAPNIYTGTIPTTNISSWVPGKTYVYTINVDEYVNVNISDEVTSSNIKKSLVVTNTGSTNAYLRAVIVGNWVDGNGKVMNHAWSSTVGEWTAKTPDGSSVTFITSGGASTDPGTGWVLGTDGYYYYKYQVPTGQVTVGTLFDTYTPADAPKNGHLEMAIAVQAIQASRLMNPDGTMKAEASAYGWKTGVLDTRVDDLNNFN